MRQKQTFKVIFVVFAIILSVLPFFISLNEFMTKIVEGNRLYGFIQELVVPFEVRIVGSVLTALGFEFKAFTDGVVLINGHWARFTWNCVGWQSLIIFIISVVFGLRGGRYTFFSKLETIFFGLTGVFLANLGRITFSAYLLAVSRPIFKLLFHNYVAAVTTVIFLLFFWWFAYRFVLEEKEAV